MCQYVIQEIEKEEVFDSAILDCRAGKLLKKGKPFIVVAEDEPYYMDVYRTIRSNENTKGRWTDEDEQQFEASRVRWNNIFPDDPDGW
jgi:hypothetical protein